MVQKTYELTISRAYEILGKYTEVMTKLFEIHYVLTILSYVISLSWFNRFVEKDFEHLWFNGSFEELFNSF